MPGYYANLKHFILSLGHWLGLVSKVFWKQIVCRPGWLGACGAASVNPRRHGGAHEAAHQLVLDLK